MDSNPIDLLAGKPIAEHLELLAQQVVEGFIIGLHKSPFHGFSVEFAEHRLYNPGDAIRHIDWRVYGRSDKLFVKKYEEETNLRCTIVLDTSSSMLYPDEKGKMNKLQYCSLAAASLMQLLKRQLDAASLILFDEQIYFQSDCRSASNHYRMLTLKLAETWKEQAQGKKSGIAQVLHQVAEQVHRRSLVVVISDMIDDSESMEAFMESLQHLRYNKHEVILFHLMDRPKERDFEFENRPYEFLDMESGEKVRLQPGTIKQNYINQVNRFNSAIENHCYQYKVTRVEVDLTAPVSQVLHAFLLKRNKML